MKRFLVLLLLCAPFMLYAQSQFDKYFTDSVLRFDFMFAGDYQTTLVYPVGLKKEPFWAGSKTKLTDPFGYGDYLYEVRDEASGTLIYSRGFCTLFREWQTTDEAKSMQRSFHEVATMPFPRNKVRFDLSKRERDGTFSKLFETVIDPEDYYILKEKPVNVGVTEIYRAGDPESCLDIVFIAEGYREGEMEKFRSDVKKMADILFSEEPFGKYRNSINIRAVEAVSEESGTDVPGENIYVNSALNSTFFTFGLDRYLTTTDIKAVNDYAAAAPHDHIVVLINSSRYGGGGVYNYYSGTTVDHALSPMVFTHEFGHGLSGLADEYYSSEVAYDEFYPFNIEPWEPNITTLVNFGAKWKNMIGEGVPVPTPPEEKYSDVTGLFEGGGYSAKGIYRPEMDCRMKSNGPKGFCSVCRAAIARMLEFYTE